MTKILNSNLMKAFIDILIKQKIRYQKYIRIIINTGYWLPVNASKNKPLGMKPCPEK